MALEEIVPLGHIDETDKKKNFISHQNRANRSSNMSTYDTVQ